MFSLPSAVRMVSGPIPETQARRPKPQTLKIPTEPRPSEESTSNGVRRQQIVIFQGWSSPRTASPHTSRPGTPPGSRFTSNIVYIYIYIHKQYIYIYIYTY